jgi:2-polyprenyl-3-methyl-5-hydroxy-6-metoxy-1,4-benzoquinol methylase
MAASEANKQRYSSPEYAATNLLAEWGDVLYPADHPLMISPLLRDIGAADSGPGRFYTSIAQLAHTWASNMKIECTRICDIGGGTGRMCSELARQFHEARELVLVEPSEQFCMWARRLLLGDSEFDGWIPVPDGIQSPGYLEIPFARLPPPVPNVTIYNALAEDVPRPSGYFDLVTCLNVVDRVADPIRMINVIGALLRPGGLLVLVDPLHFEEEFTERSKWVRDLRELLGDKRWRIAGREADVKHAILHYNRRLNCYMSQVVGAERVE